MARKVIGTLLLVFVGVGIPILYWLERQSQTAGQSVAAAHEALAVGDTLEAITLLADALDNFVWEDEQSSLAKEGLLLAHLYQSQGQADALPALAERLLALDTATGVQAIEAVSALVCQDSTHCALLAESLTGYDPGLNLGTYPLPLMLAAREALTWRLIQGRLAGLPNTHSLPQFHKENSQHWYLERWNNTDATREAETLRNTMAQVFYEKPRTLYLHLLEPLPDGGRRRVFRGRWVCHNPVTEGWVWQFPGQAINGEPWLPDSSVLAHYSTDLTHNASIAGLQWLSVLHCVKATGTETLWYQALYQWCEQASQEELIALAHDVQLLYNNEPEYCDGYDCVLFNAMLMENMPDEMVLLWARHFPKGGFAGLRHVTNLTHSYSHRRLEEGIQGIIEARGL